MGKHEQHKVQGASLMAYIDLFDERKTVPSIGKRELEVLKGFNRWPQATALMLAKKLGYDDPNKVRPRITEMAKPEVGLLNPCGLRVMPESGSNKASMSYEVSRKGLDILEYFYARERAAKVLERNGA